MTIIDSHCHAWARWPYQPSVPDAESRGRIEQLLHEMDANGVDRAALVCANIDHNPDNNDYIAQQVKRYPQRLYQIADVDCMWSQTYHQPGAADRLRRAAERWPMKGFTHYLKQDEDGAWLHSQEGLAFFAVAADLNLIASISCHPHQQAAIRRVAERFPSVPILLHHLGHPKVGGEGIQGLQEILASAPFDNVYIKLSGFAYATAGPKWAYPYTDTHDIIRAEYEHFGPRRLCWGSDYPVVRFFMTYRQALEALRTHCDFIPEADQARILGENLDELLAAARPLA